MVKFPVLTDAQVAEVDFFNNHNAMRALDVLQNLPYVLVSGILAAGATGDTTNEHVFVAPVKGEILEVKFIMTTVQTGTSNTPVVKLMNGTAEVGASAAIALSGAIGDVASVVLDTAEVDFAAGDKLIFRIVNPTATITVAIQGKLQIIWKPKA
jgi:hypothetical protein